MRLDCSFGSRITAQPTAWIVAMRGAIVMPAPEATRGKMDPKWSDSKAGAISALPRLQAISISSLKQ